MVQAQSQPVDTPYGKMPMWKAKQMADFQKTQAEAETAGFKPVGSGGLYDARTGKTMAPIQTKTPSPEQQVYDARIKQGDTPEQALEHVKAIGKEDKEPTNSFQAYRAAFKAKNQRDMTPEEIDAYDKRHAQNIHINTGQNDVPPDDFETLVQGLVKGSIDPKSAFGRGGTQLRARAIAEATRRDPKFSMADYPLRQQAYQYFFGGGKGADQIQSANTLIQHSKDLSDVVNDYRATGSPLLNKPLNWIRKNYGDATYSRYVTALQPVRDEFMTYLQNNHALTNEDRKAGDLILSDDATPAQQQEAIKQLSHTAAIRLGENNNRYRRVFGEDYPEILPPDSEKFLRDVGAYDSVFKNKVKGRSSAAPSGSPKTPPPSKDGITFIPLG
jgi:hypothetical protein